MRWVIACGAAVVVLVIIARALKPRSAPHARKDAALRSATRVLR